MKIGLIYSNILRDYDFGPGRPFRRDRFESFITHFQETLYKSSRFDLVTRAS